MVSVLRPINNIAVSVFAVIVGFKMWFDMEGISAVIALMVIFIGVSALESNIVTIVKQKRKRDNLIEKAER